MAAVLRYYYGGVSQTTPNDFNASSFGCNKSFIFRCSGTYPFGLTTKTNALNYCKLSFDVNGTKHYFGRTTSKSVVDVNNNLYYVQDDVGHQTMYSQVTSDSRGYNPDTDYTTFSANKSYAYEYYRSEESYLTRQSEYDYLTRESVSGYLTRESIYSYLTRESTSGYNTRSSTSAYSVKLSGSITVISSARRTTNSSAVRTNTVTSSVRTGLVSTASVKATITTAMKCYSTLTRVRSLMTDDWFSGQVTNYTASTEVTSLTRDAYSLITWDYKNYYTPEDSAASAWVYKNETVTQYYTWSMTSAGAEVSGALGTVSVTEKSGSQYAAGVYANYSAYSKSIRQSGISTSSNSSRYARTTTNKSFSRTRHVSGSHLATYENMSAVSTFNHTSGALTRSSTSQTLTRSSTYSTLTRSSTYSTLTRSSTYSTLTRSSTYSTQSRTSYYYCWHYSVSEHNF